MEHIELLAGDSARAKWAKIIEDHGGSGLAVAGFCRERSLAVSSFYDWRRRLESPRAGAGFVEVKGMTDSRGARASDGVAPESVAVDVHSAGVRIELAGGRRVVVTRGFERRLLSDVIGAIVRDDGRIVMQQPGRDGQNAAGRHVHRINRDTPHPDNFTKLLKTCPVSCYR